MVLRDPLWSQNVPAYSALEDRRVFTALYTPGVIMQSSADTAFKVTAGAGLSVDVDAGYAIVAPGNGVDQGSYLVWNDGSVNVAVTPPGAGTQNQSVILTVADSAVDGGGTDAPVLSVVATASKPAGALTLATFDIASDAATVSGITDARSSAQSNASGVGLSVVLGRFGGKTGVTKSVQDITAFKDLTYHDGDTHFYGEAWFRDEVHMENALSWSVHPSMRSRISGLFSEANVGTGSRTTNLLTNLSAPLTGVVWISIQGYADISERADLWIRLMLVDNAAQVVGNDYQRVSQNDTTYSRTPFNIRGRVSGLSSTRAPYILRIRLETSTGTANGVHQIRGMWEPGF